MTMLDIWESAAVTAVVRRNIEEQANANDGGENRQFFGQNIAPLVGVNARTTRIRIADVLPYGLGQFKAPDASPPMFKTKPTLKEQVIELVLLEEMERFTSEEWLLLNADDASIAQGARLSLVDRMRIMQLRNERLTEWMRWSAFKGSLAITYPDGGTITVDYGFATSHLPTAGTAWTDLTNSDPLADMYAWTQVGADDAGRYYSIVHLNTVTWRLVQYNAKVKSYLGALGRQIMLPTRSDLQQLMREGTSNFEILDAGYLPTNATNRRLTKFLPDNRILMTTDYVLDGERIADVADGQVLVGGDTGSAPDARAGFQTEVIGNPFTKNVFRRAASARIPRLYFPEAFLYATVGA
jgi:Phage major capsid protein E